MSLNALTSINIRILTEILKYLRGQADCSSTFRNFDKLSVMYFASPPLDVAKTYTILTRIKMIALWKLNRPQFVVGTNPWKMQYGWSLAHISCAQQPLLWLLCHSREREWTQHNHSCQLMSEAINIWHKMPQYSHHSRHHPTHSWQTEFRCYIITFCAFDNTKQQMKQWQCKQCRWPESHEDFCQYFEA